MSEATDIFRRPEIFDRIPFDDHALIEASAGTGKTYAIERLVAHLLVSEEDVRLPEILVVTFTERATGELRERIRGLLERFLRGPSDAGSAEERDIEGLEAEYWEVDAAARKRLERALFSFDLAPIHTMHGFCRRILREHAFAHHRSFELEYVDAEALFERAFPRALRERFSEDAKLRPYLEAWFREVSRPLERLRRQLSALVRESGTYRSPFAPGELAAAAREFAETDVMVDRLEAEVGEAMHHATWGAVEGRVAWLERATERFCETGDMPELLAALERDGGGKEVAGYLASTFEEYDFTGPAGSRLRALFEHAVPIEQAVLWRFRPEMEAVLEEEKRRRSEMTFDDMLAYVWEALEGEQGEALARALREDYRVGVIDEFQDTDALQWKIFRRIFCEGEGDNRLYLVGDPKQAIYGFRGADVFTYYEARDEIVGPSRRQGCRRTSSDGKDAVAPMDGGRSVATGATPSSASRKTDGQRRVELPKNYRSTPAMVAAANRLFSGAFFTGRNGEPEPVEPGRPAFRAEWAGGDTVVPVQLLEMSPRRGKDGEPEQMSMAQLRETYAAGCAREIAMLLEEPDAFVLRDPEAGERRRLAPGGIHVLARTRREGRRIGRHLRERGVPFAFYKREGLFETDEARHIYTLLRAVADPHDRSLRQKAWLTPFFDLDLEQLDRCRGLGESESPLRELCRWHELAEERAFGRLFDDILSESGLVRRELFAGESERELTNYRHIFEILVDESRRQQATVGKLALRMESWIAGIGGSEDREAIQRLESERDAVQIMTMHKAKGLEADVVFVAPTFNGVGPSSPAKVYHDDEGERIVQVGELEPELEKRWEAERREAAERLLYVAITRARARVYLPYVAPDGGDYPMSCEPGGTFRVAARAIEPIVEELERGEERELFQRRRPALSGPGRPSDAATGGEVNLSGWSPPEDLLEVPLDPGDYRRLRRRTSEVVSFSRLSTDRDDERRGSGGDGDDIDGAAVRPRVRHEDELPSNVGAGLMLHAIFEKLDFEVAARHPEIEGWMADPEVDTVVREEMRWRLDEASVDACLDHTKRMVYRTLMTPIRAAPSEGGGAPVELGRLAEVCRKDREAEFYYPTPTPDDTALEERLFEKSGGEAFEVRDGFVNGQIDLLFERDGRLYIADWKSNRRASYAPGRLARYIDREYALQLKMYVSAAARAIEAPNPAAFDERMGGFCFLFVRGIGPTDEPATPGVYFRSVDFETVRSFERDLREIGGRR